MVTAGNHSRRGKTAGEGGNFTISLYPERPFRLDLTVWALRRRPENRIDRWDGRTYWRTLWTHTARRPVEVSAVQVKEGKETAIELTVDPIIKDKQAIDGISRTIGTMLGMDRDLTAFYRMASRDSRLDAFTRPFIGFKPPCFPTVFEGLINGIACQQLSLAVGITLLNRLALACDPHHGAGIEPAFPRPDDIEKLRVEDLRTMGFSVRKAETVLDCARAVASGDLDLDALGDADDDEVRERLEAIKGVGRWTAEYVLLRGLGRVSVFPGHDVGARAKLERWLRPAGTLDYDKVRKITEAWHPYAGLVYFHLLLNELARKGYVHI